MTLIDTLNSQFALADHLRFENLSQGLPVATISTPLATAQIALHGAHLLAWQPAGQEPVIWVSKAAIFEDGKPIRGGIPVCWPWFGAVPGQPMHGFARTRAWQVRGSQLAADGQVVLRLGMSDDGSTRELWNHAFDLEMVLTVGKTLSLALITRNTGDTPFGITQALHTYFCVGDIGQTTVLGLAGHTYLDKVQDFAQMQQVGAVQFSSETDRVYLDTQDDCVIEDAALGRKIRISKQGSATTVVWNPWAEREKNIADMAAGEHRGMVCVETCNAGPDQRTLAPGEQHTLGACISVD